MDATCFKCGSKLVPGDPEPGGTTSALVSSKWGDYHRGHAKNIKHTSYKCPTCRKTRAVST